MFFFRSCVPQDTYNNLKKQLKDLQRRHTEFRKVIVTQGVQQVPIGDMSFASINLDASVLPNYSFNEQVSYIVTFSYCKTIQIL